ncbi:MAG TPA: zf-HC2 domain-containing protein [Anaeromyxobacteraceae bacterium]|nr:zf-HC2 domain-containing protein [Anaeromyxobacteraceae bacterium]
MTPARTAPGCVRFAPMLGARPGELTDDEHLALADHLAECDACQARLADGEAIADLLPDALMAEARRRDFAAFSDGVLARIPEYARAGRRERGGLWGWVRHHRAAAALSALAPAMAALALVVYLDRASAPPDAAPYEVVAEGRGATVLDTSEGPVVLLGDADESQGT